jgi:hypothetical protein
MRALEVRSDVFHTKFRDAILGELSGAIAKNYIADIAQFHRIQASPGFSASIDHVKGLLDPPGSGNGQRHSAGE